MNNYNILKQSDGHQLAAKMWTQGVPVDSKAYDQIRNTASLPFIYKWVAAMPDVHVGMGATIGTVLPTKGAIIPASVGVDGGCFVGSTKIPLLNGSDKSLKELYNNKEKNFYVYSVDSEGLYRISIADEVKLTRKNAALVKIILDNDKSIICTLDHQFLTSSLDYIEAKNLVPGQSLFPLYRLEDQVKSIELLNYTEDVYCISVPEYGNFALSAGVIVHNCGMVAQKTNLTANDLPDSLTKLRNSIERTIPIGTPSKGTNRNKGSWQSIDKMPPYALQEWKKVEKFNDFLPHIANTKHAKILSNARPELQLGSLGGGNHFIEICLDEEDNVWAMLHSGSRGIGNKLGRHFIELAKKDMERYFISLPDRDLAYLTEGSEHFDDYVKAMMWVQNYAKINREVMMHHVLEELSWAVKHTKDLRALGIKEKAVNCFSGETRVITKYGTKEIKNLYGNSYEILTIDGKWITSPIKSFGKQSLMKIILSRCGTKKEIYVTPKHAWIISPVQRNYTFEKTTRDLLPGDRLASVFPEKLNIIPSTEGSARGFVFGDGSTTSKNKSCALFCGEKISLLNLFKENKLGLEPRPYENFTRVSGLPIEWKRDLPSLQESNEDLYGWLAGYFAADGDVDKSGRPTLVSSKRENLEFVRDLANKISVGTFGIRESMRVGYGKEPTPRYLLGIMRNDLNANFFLRDNHRERFESCKVAERRNWIVETVEETSRFEEVYCAVVDNHHCFALEDNILTKNCHHNYVAKENHFGSNVWITRKGAVRAREGDLSVIPGSMGTKSFIVEGLGNPDSFTSCSHGAGRVMSRSQAKREISLDQHIEAVKGIECRIDEGVIDESPAAYKSIEAVMAAQVDLVEVKHTLKQLVCIKG